MEINCFVNFEAVEEEIDKIDVVEENIIENVNDVDFIDNNKKFDENTEDYYVCTIVIRSVEYAMQDSFIDFDYSQKANDYCLGEYKPRKETIDEFKDSAKTVENFNSTLLIPQGFENIDPFYHGLLYAIWYQLKKKNKIECGNDDELKKEIDNDQLYDVLSAANGKLRFDLDIQNFKNQCFSVNDLLNKYGLFLRVYELKDKFCYVIKQDSKIYQFSEIYRAVSLKNLMDLTSFVSSSAKVETTFLSNWYNLQAYKKVWWHNKLLFQWEIEHSFLCKF